MLNAALCLVALLLGNTADGPWLRIVLPLHDEHFVGDQVSVHMAVSLPDQRAAAAAGREQRHICVLYNQEIECTDVGSNQEVREIFP